MFDAGWNGAAAIRSNALASSTRLAGNTRAMVVSSQCRRALRECPSLSLPPFTRVGNPEETSCRVADYVVH